MLRVEYDAKDAFVAQTQETGNWEAIKEKYLKSKAAAGEEQTVKNLTQILKALVEYRDLIDFRMYRKAVEAVFPTGAYNLVEQVNGLVENNEGHPRFAASWYEFVVTLRALPVAQNESKCIIRVNAPGSRSLTSDIDTSLMVKIVGDISSLLQFAPRVKDKAPDYKGRITNLLIDGFYTLSEEEFGLTSGEHRDSNVYVDLSVNEEDEYPKFRSDAKRNPVIADEQIFKPEQLVPKMADFKLKKHRLELAASLFSLRVALGVEGWKLFKEKVNKTIQSCSTQLEDGRREGEEKAKVYAISSIEDVEKVFIKTEDFFGVYEKSLHAKREQLRLSIGQVQPNTDKEAQERNLEVSALNRLYVEYLEKMTDLNDEILKFQYLSEEIVKELQPLDEDLKREERKFEKYKADEDDDFRDEISKQEQKCASLRKKQEDYIKKLKDSQFKIVDLELEKLEIRYQAHTFANEAYVCRSAVYHVVTGIQQGGKIEINEQTLLSSALQQIGFRLLHAQELAKRKKSVGEIVYRTAKYSQRIYQLLFDKPRIDKEITALYNSGRLTLLPKLKSEETKKGLSKLFTLDELLLLNSEVKIVGEVKNNLAIPEAEKYNKAGELLGNMIDPKELFLSLASKFLAVVYLSRFERRHSLWGGFESNKPLQITYLLDKFKKREPADVLEKEDSRKKIKLSSEEEIQPQTTGMALMEVDNMNFEGKFDAETMGNSATSILRGSTVKKDTKVRTIGQGGFQSGSK